MVKPYKSKLVVSTLSVILCHSNRASPHQFIKTVNKMEVLIKLNYTTIYYVKDLNL